MTRLILAFFLFFLSSFSGDEFLLKATIEISADYIETDNLYNLYSVEGSTLKKYSPDGNLLKSYSEKTRGKIERVDASNPMKLMLYYKDFGWILFLDNNLNPIGNPVNLSQTGIDRIILASNSQHEGFWVFDGANTELLKMSNDGKVIQKTGNLPSLLGMKINPVYLGEANKQVYMGTEANGILVFDIFGTYLKTIPLKEIQRFQVKEDNLYYFKTGQLHCYNLRNLTDTAITVPGDKTRNCLIEKDLLFVQGEKSIRIYRGS